MKAIMPVKDNNDWKAELNPRFGRTPYFAVVDLEEKSLEFIKNSAQNAASGAGVEAAQLVADQKADIMFTPNIGPKAFSGLQSLNLEIYMAKGTIEKAVKDYKNDELKKVSKPTNRAYHDH